MSTVTHWFLSATISDLISLARVEQLNPANHQKLVRSFQSFRQFDAADLPTLERSGLTAHQAKAVKERSRDTKSEERLMEEHGIGWVAFGTKDYPALLAEIADPPLWLFYRGNLQVLRRPTLTVVGTRKPSQYARAVIDFLLPDQLLRQVVTVSGLAYGVDELIHRRSVAFGQTVAVLAGGLDVIYPSSNTRLAQEIVRKGGLLLSEYPPGVRPQPYRFPIRNRIVAGLSAATLIVEATIKSGTLTTAKAALDYNRDIFAVPGRITDLSSAGGNFLIQSGAILLAEPQQLLDYYGMSFKPSDTKPLDTDAAKLLDLLTGQPQTLDELVAQTSVGVENLLGLITRLELSGHVYQDAAGRYCPKQ